MDEALSNNTNNNQLPDENSRELMPYFTSKRISHNIWPSEAMSPEPGMSSCLPPYGLKLQTFNLNFLSKQASFDNSLCIPLRLENPPKEYCLFSLLEMVMGSSHYETILQGMRRGNSKAQFKAAICPSLPCESIS